MTTTEFAPHAPTLVRRHLHLQGVVQGVGFRPHVARLARDLELTGRCSNGVAGVQIEVEGPADAVAAFTTRVVAQAPPLAQVRSVTSDDRPARGDADFVIVASDDRGTGEGATTLVPADVAVCDECLAEMRDPHDRRYGHPFITCTNCGPRATIVLDLPYDRPLTTMADFPLCDACGREYADPLDRRYHAQPISCHGCGPALRLVAPIGTFLSDRSAALDAAIAALADGSIVAIKGIGGVHLACDAGNAAAIATLRERKGRPDRPFAVMAADLEVAGRLVELEPAAQDLLTSPARPIVVLPALDGTDGPDAFDRPGGLVAAGVAPHLHELGVMLPYAPLHHLLFDDPRTPRVLVMTSGNAAGEPLCHDDADALARLAGLADVFLLHDRRIHTPHEDSVMTLDEGTPMPVRRSRGYAPLPVLLPEGSDLGDLVDCDRDTVVLSAGAEVKNTFAVVGGREAFVSAHVGDLESPATRRALDHGAAAALRFHRKVPGLVVADAHPGYASRAWAADLAASFDAPFVQIQHHHAHLAALAAEHDALDRPLLGIVFDGTGFGDDGTIWGGEILLLDDGGATSRRLGHLGTFPLPGGDAGVRNPVRMAAAALHRHGIDWPDTLTAALTGPEARALPRLLDGASGWVETSSAGRLFDVVAALLGVRARISYEAQAAIELESLAAAWARREDPARAPRLELPVIPADGRLVLDGAPLLRGIVDGVSGADLEKSAGALAWAFHDVLARAAADAAARLADEHGLTDVGLSGGVFQNRLLVARCRAHLRAAGLDTLTHRVVPANDGGLCLGQAAAGIAVHRRALRREERSH